MSKDTNLGHGIMLSAKSSSMGRDSVKSESLEPKPSFALALVLVRSKRQEAARDP